MGSVLSIIQGRKSRCLTIEQRRRQTKTAQQERALRPNCELQKSALANDLAAQQDGEEKECYH